MEKGTVKLGYTVSTVRHKHRGVVYGIARTFDRLDEDDEWFDVQNLPREARDERWISILIDGGGAVSVPESDIAEVLIQPPVYNGNPYYKDYFDLM